MISKLDGKGVHLTSPVEAVAGKGLMSTVSPKKKGLKARNGRLLLGVHRVGMTGETVRSKVDERSTYGSAARSCLERRSWKG